MEDRLYYLAFSANPLIGPAKFRKLLAEFGTAKAAWSSLARGRLARLRLARLKEFSIEDYLRKLKEKDVWFVTLLDEEYPQLLKEIKNPPFVLYGRGNIEILSARQTTLRDDVRLRIPKKQALTSVSLSKNRPQTEAQPIFGSPASDLPRSTACSSIAVVGSRKTTEYGREVTEILTRELVANGFTIVSGLALGVDAISHMTALENNGKTIAVLGCGVDCCFPGENLTIYNSIVEKGCVVSEFPLGMKPTKWTFPARNRIIAGLSQAVLVTEGAKDSGSLITANFALKFGRKVFAVPGPITSSMSKGPLSLISKGAKLVTSAKDILDDLGFMINDLRVKKTAKKGDTKEEDLILKILENGALHFDELVRRTKFKSSTLSSLLSLMEIKGMVKSLDGGAFALN